MLNFRKSWLGIVGMVTLGTTLGLWLLPQILNQQTVTSVTATDGLGVEALDGEGATMTESDLPESQRGSRWRSLNLSPAQIQQLQRVRAKYQPNIREQSRQLRTARGQFRQLLISGADNAEIKTQFAQLQGQRQALDQLRLENIMALRGILTPEQRQAFGQKRQQPLNPRGQDQPEPRLRRRRRF